MLADQSLQIRSAIRSTCFWVFWTTPCWEWGHVYFDALRSWHSRMVSTGGQNRVIDNLVPHVVCYEKRPTTVATPMSFNTSTSFLRRSLQSPQMQSVQMSPELSRQYTLHSLKATMLSISKQVDVPEHHRAEQGHHRQQGGRASVRLHSRDDVWEGGRWHASDLFCRKSQKVFDHSQRKDAERRFPRMSPWWKSTRSPFRWKLPPVIFTAYRSYRRQPPKCVLRHLAHPNAHPNYRRSSPSM